MKNVHIFFRFSKKSWRNLMNHQTKEQRTIIHQNLLNKKHISIFVPFPLTINLNRSSGPHKNLNVDSFPIIYFDAQKNKDSQQKQSVVTA